MPTAPQRVCARCRQPAPKGRRCACRPAFEGAAKRTAGRRWRQLRAMKLRANWQCEHEGCPRLADEVDHIVPLAEGGPEFEWNNLAALCADHHRMKSATDAQRGRTRAR